MSKVMGRVDRYPTSCANWFGCGSNDLVLIPGHYEFWPVQPEQFGGDTELERAETVVGNRYNFSVFEHGCILTYLGRTATSRIRWFSGSLTYGNDNQYFRRCCNHGR
jgi:hypothetical protein